MSTPECDADALHYVGFTFHEEGPAAQLDGPAFHHLNVILYIECYCDDHPLILLGKAALGKYFLFEGQQHHTVGLDP